MRRRRWSLVRELVVVVLSVGLASLAVTLLAVGLDLLDVRKAARVARKLLVPFAIVAYLLCLRLGLRELPLALGLVPVRRPVAAVLRGFVIGAASFLAMNLLLLACGARIWSPDLGPWPLALKVMVYFLQAVGLGFLEETLFRGLLHGRLAASGGPVTAVGLGSLIFALSHFLRPARPHGGSDPWTVMVDCFAGVGRAVDRWREVVGLFLVGAVLAALRQRTGAVLLSLGVHAGWVWCRFSVRRATDRASWVTDAHEWLQGSSRVYDGLAGWLALLLTLALALAWSRAWRRPG